MLHGRENYGTPAVWLFVSLQTRFMAGSSSLVITTLFVNSRFILVLKDIFQGKADGVVAAWLQGEIRQVHGTDLLLRTVTTE
jgi:hypothetical protein